MMLEPLAAWESFYVIVGSCAGALTGLQFVVITLIAQTPGGGSLREVAAFGTPTVVHFCAVLLTAAILSAPWHSVSSVGLLLSACGVAGVAYSVIVFRRARRQTGYRPVLEDWIFHALLPLGAYGVLFGGAVRLTHHVESALFLIAGASLVMLFIGIHNAWDAVTYLAVEWLPGQRKPNDQQ